MRAYIALMFVLVLSSLTSPLSVPVAEASVIPQVQDVVQGTISPIAEPIQKSIVKPVKKIVVRNSFLATTFAELGPVMRAVAVCESNGVHARNGRVTRNPVTPDWGLFQLNRVHFPEMKSLGLNPMIEADNIKFAMILYQRNGLADWEMSRGCWQGMV